MKIFDKVDPKGYVVLKDINGNIIRANYNTIVNEGKKTLIAKLLNNFLINSEVSDNEINKEDANFNFHGICFGCNMSETTTLTTFAKNSEYKEFLTDGTENPLYFKFAKDFKEDHTSDHGLSEFMVHYDEDARRWYLAITVRVLPGSLIETDNNHLSWDENFKNAVCSLAIILKNETTEEYRLFSRFRFDPIPITSDSEFILTYYIYF